MSNPSTLSVRRPSTSNRQPWEMVRRALHDPDLQPSEKVLLLCVLDHAGHGKSACTASNATLSRESGLADRRTREILAELEAEGWLLSVRAKGKFGHRSLYPGPRAEGGTPPPGGWRCTARGLALHRPDPGTPPPPNGLDNEPINDPDPFASKWFGHLNEFRETSDG